MRIFAIKVSVQVLQALSGSNQVSKLTVRFLSVSFPLDRIDEYFNIIFS